VQRVRPARAALVDQHHVALAQDLAEGAAAAGKASRADWPGPPASMNTGRAALLGAARDERHRELDAAAGGTGVISGTASVPQNAATVAGEPAAASVQGSKLSEPARARPRPARTGVVVAPAQRRQPIRRTTAASSGRSAHGRLHGRRAGRRNPSTPRTRSTAFRLGCRGHASPPPVTRALLFLNVGVFVLQVLTGDLLLRPFALWPSARRSTAGSRSSSPGSC